jgi:hypothetical protein
MDGDHTQRTKTLLDAFSDFFVGTKWVSNVQKYYSEYMQTENMEQLELARSELHSIDDDLSRVQTQELILRSRQSELGAWLQENAVKPVEERNPTGTQHTHTHTHTSTHAHTTQHTSSHTHTRHTHNTQHTSSHTHTTQARTRWLIVTDDVLVACPVEELVSMESDRLALLEHRLNRLKNKLLKQKGDVAAFLKINGTPPPLICSHRTPHTHTHSTHTRVAHTA